jgi:hypothetical protein
MAILSSAARGPCKMVGMTGRLDLGLAGFLLGISLICATSAGAQGAATQGTAPGTVEVKSSPPGDPRELEIVAPSRGAREVSRPREADFYKEDIRVRHEPGFVEPLTTYPATGPVRKVGLSGWTAPPGRGDGIVQHEVNGWFGFGLSIVWE